MRADEIGIDDPCPVPESEMERTASGDHCARCRKHVQDLSQMTEAAAIAFRELNPTACVSYWADADGHLVHAPAKELKLLRPRTATALSMVALSVACNREAAPGDTLENATAVSASVASAELEPGCELTESESSTASGATAQTVVPSASAPVPTQLTRTRGIPRRPRCDPPWFLDAKGVRRANLDCL